MPISIHQKITYRGWIKVSLEYNRHSKEEIDSYFAPLWVKDTSGMARVWLKNCNTHGYMSNYFHFKKHVDKRRKQK
jgi:hypothetical protein